MVENILVEQMNREELEEFNQVPVKVPKWMTYELDESDEELYIGQFQLFEDKNPWATRDDYRFLNSERNNEFPDDSNIKQPATLNRQHKSCLRIIDVSEHWLSHMELPNPYWAIYPFFGNKDKKGNSDASDIIELNKVQRKHLDGVTKYMGDPNYIEDVWDKFLYYDITAVTSGDERVSLKIFTPQYNSNFYKIEESIKWVNDDLYIPCEYKKGRWQPSMDSARFIEVWAKHVKGIKSPVIVDSNVLDGNLFKSWNPRHYNHTDKEAISAVNNIVKNYVPKRQPAFNNKVKVISSLHEPKEGVA